MNVTLFIIDDSTLGIQQQRDWETPGGVSPIAECMFMGQKYKIGVLIIAHLASAMSHIICQNIRAWFITGLPGETISVIRNLLGMNSEQAEATRSSLVRGQFVCFNPLLWPRAVYASFAQPVIPGICDESMRKVHLQVFLAAVKTMPPAPLEVFGVAPVPAAGAQGQAAAGAGKAVLPEQVQMLVVVASGVPKTAGKVYEAMGSSRAQCRKMAAALEAAGAMAVHRFSTGRVGGQICFFEVLDHGWTILEARGTSRPAALTNGGFEHELAAQLLKAEAKRNNLAVQFEVDVGGVRVDAVMTDKNSGSRIYCQIGISRPNHEVDSIEKFFTLPVSQNARFVLIARDVPFTREMTKIFKARKIADAIVRRVHMRVIADLVKE